jgi:glutamate 5-kinase
MTVVAKLGSSIVADDNGALRSAVLDSVCGQVAELHGGGENVVLVTSGAIARGMRLLELDQRPSAIDEMQAASAVGQGSLFRAYEERLGAQEVHAAQVLLTSFDMSARMHYLNARQTLRRLLDWRVVPVVNENDTTATDEITFGDNDFLSAQVSILLEARLLVLLTDTPGLHTADPRVDAEAKLIKEVKDFSELREYRIGDRTSTFGSGGMRSKVAAAEMASAAGIPVVVCDGTEPGSFAAAARGEPVGTRFAAHPERTASFKLWLRYAKPSQGRIVVDKGAARVLRERGSSLLPVGITEVEGEFAAGDAVEVVCDTEVVGKGIANYSAAELGRIKGLKSAQVRERIPNASQEAVHRDYFVLT